MSRPTGTAGRRPPRCPQLRPAPHQPGLQRQPVPPRPALPRQALPRRRCCQSARRLTPQCPARPALRVRRQLDAVQRLGRCVCQRRRRRRSLCGREQWRLSPLALTLIGHWRRGPPAGNAELLPPQLRQGRSHRVHQHRVRQHPCEHGGRGDEAVGILRPHARRVLLRRGQRLVLGSQRKLLRRDYQRGHAATYGPTEVVWNWGTDSGTTSWPFVPGQSFRTSWPNYVVVFEGAASSLGQWVPAKLGVGLMDERTRSPCRTATAWRPSSTTPRALL